MAAQPATASVRGRHASSAGTSYPTQWYEAVVEVLLDQIAITDESAVQRVVAELTDGRKQSIDQLALARIARARSEALRRLDETRDIETWQATVTRLDAEEAAARAPAQEGRVMSEDEIRSYLANIGAMWRSADDESRQGMALALFDRLAAVGFQALEYDWSAAAKAYGLDRIVLPELTIDLGKLGLRGSPKGEFSLRSAQPRPALAVLEAAG